MANSSNNEFQYAFRLNDNYYFDRFENDEQFFDSAQKWIDNKSFLVVFGCLNNTDCGGHVLLFFSHQYFPVEELRGYLKEGAYFAIRSDLFKGYSMRNRLKDFGFLEYSIQECIQLFGDDHKLIKNIIDLIEKETKMTKSDIHSNILFSYLNLLLQHMQRIYQQSMNDKINELNLLYQKFVIKLEALFDTEEKSMHTLPNLALLSKKLDCTARFLNDVSLKISNNTAQHHIDLFIVKITKQLLSETDLSVAEIAEKIKFDQPQSLTRLFKRRTRISPLDYRISII